jgi:hypothetical protein
VDQLEKFPEEITVASALETYQFVEKFVAASKKKTLQIEAPIAKQEQKSIFEMQPNSIVSDRRKNVTERRSVKQETKYSGKGIQI